MSHTLLDDIDSLLKKGTATSSVELADAGALSAWAQVEIKAAKQDQNPVTKRARLVHLRTQVGKGTVAFKGGATDFEVVVFDAAAAQAQTTHLSDLTVLTSSLDAALKTETGSAAEAEGTAAGTGAGAELGEGEGAGEGEAAAEGEEEEEEEEGEGEDDAAAEDEETVEKGWVLADEADPFGADMKDLKLDSETGKLLRRKQAVFE